jgi:hypothetical protein
MATAIHPICFGTPCPQKDITWLVPPGLSGRGNTAGRRLAAFQLVLRRLERGLHDISGRRSKIYGHCLPLFGGQTISPRTCGNLFPCLLVGIPWPHKCGFEGKVTRGSYARLPRFRMRSSAKIPHSSQKFFPTVRQYIDCSSKCLIHFR